MHRLGYTRYVAQGGDVGAFVTDAMGRLAPEGLAGIHMNLLVTTLGGAMAPAESEQERAAADAIATFRTSGFGYFPIDADSTGPQPSLSLPGRATPSAPAEPADAVGFADLEEPFSGNRDSDEAGPENREFPVSNVPSGNRTSGGYCFHSDLLFGAGSRAVRDRSAGTSPGEHRRELLSARPGSPRGEDDSEK